MGEVGWRLKMGGGVRGASSKPRETGAAAQEKAEGVAEKNPKGLREGRLGLGAGSRTTAQLVHTSSPDPPLAHESNQNSTILLVNASPKIPNPKSVPPERKKEKRNKERINSNFSCLQTGYHTRPCT
jgi:hypothetical protein